MASNDDAQTSRRDYGPTYNSKHPVPTIQGYLETKANQKENLEGTASKDTDASGPPIGHEASSAGVAEKSINRRETENERNKKEVQDHDQVDTSQVKATSSNVKDRRHELKHRAKDGAEREVTDPVTHLPVKIRDFTDDDLKKFKDAGENEESPRSARSRSRGISGTSRTLSKRDGGLHKDNKEQQKAHDGLSWKFPPPSFQEARDDLQKIYTQAFLVGLTAIALVCPVAFWSSGLLVQLASNHHWNIGGMVAMLFATGIVVVVCILVTLTLRFWVLKKFQNLWEDELWEAEREQSKGRLQSDVPESTLWFNKLIGSIWPLVNPDLFASLADTLEDVMQASLPSFVRMVSVEDLGQGSDSLRILGVRWLPKGAATHSVESNGEIDESIKDDEKSLTKDRTSHSSNQAQGSHGKEKKGLNTESGEDNHETSQGQESNVAGGMKPEEGDFVNLQIAFAYRATRSRKKFRDRAKHAHLYLAFYLPGNLKIPIWVELQGLIGTARIRMQLTPDPPFVQLATITFMGQPKVDISCVPLVKHGLNIMDIPLISNFVQSAVDAAMSEYVAPKSLTLDLKNMISGEDFKKDTSARGVLRIHIKRALDFKAADTSIPLIRKGSSDPYVSVGWAKFGKALWSTRVLIDEMEPYWEEETFLLVGPEEVDAEESLRVQLWDSDRGTADDDLGRIEIPVKHLMKHEKSNGQMWHRIDTFQAMKKGETMPGRLEWSVGYFTKARLQDYQVAHSTGKSEVKTVKDLERQSFEQSNRKLRETAHGESEEVKQLRKQDFEDASIDIISRSPPDERYPSGILSIVVHQITGLELEVMNRPRDEDGGEQQDEEDEGSDLLPDSYCTIMLNDNRIYKTRTKPKSSNPFFNAGTERFIRDWRATSIMVSVRDARVHEDDALLGVVHIPLGPAMLARKATRFVGYHPIAGGIGYGRVKISIVFRSVQMHLPSNLLGWDYGTLDITPEMNWVGSNLPDEIKNCKIRIRTIGGKGKLYPNTRAGHDHGLFSGHASEVTHSRANEEPQTDIKWTGKRRQQFMLPVRNRYAQPLILEFRSHHHHRVSNHGDSNHGILDALSPKALLGSKTTAFAVLWLSSLPDEEEQELEMEVWRHEGIGQHSNIERATHNTLPGEKCGEKLGMLRCKIRFWRGLGTAHSGWAKRSEHLQDTMEVLAAASDEGLITGLVGDSEWLKASDRGEIGDRGMKGGEVEGDSSDSDDEDDSTERAGHEHDDDQSRHGRVGTARNGENDRPSIHDEHYDDKNDYDDAQSLEGGKTSLTNMEKETSGGHHGGLIDAVKDYKKNRHELHRKQRGLMQWKAPRTLDWMKHKAEHTVEKIASKFEHHERQSKIETEA